MAVHTITGIASFLTGLFIIISALSDGITWQNIPASFSVRATFLLFGIVFVGGAIWSCFVP